MRVESFIPVETAGKDGKTLTPCSLAGDVADHVVGKAFHLLDLRAALQQEQIHPNRLKLGDAVENLLRRAHEACPQAAIAH